MKKIVNKIPVALVITDVHLDKGNGYLVKDIFSQAIEVCKKRGILHIICAGDVFTSRSGQPLECLKAFQEILHNIEENKLHIIAIAGNHDKTDGNEESSYLDVYANSANLDLCKKASSFWFEDVVRIDLIPYFGVERWKKELISLRELEIGEKNILITHMAFNGVRNNDGSEVVDSISPSDVSYYDLVLCGHYHDRSSVGKNIKYIGSAYQNNYGEGIVDKGFCILYEDASIEYIPSRFPKYIKEVIKASDRDSLVNLLEKYGEDRSDGNFIRFEFVGSKSELERIDVTEIQTRYGIDCKFKSVEEKEAVDIASGEEVLSWDVNSVTKDFYKFCSENNIRGEELKYGIGLIKILKK